MSTAIGHPTCKRTTLSREESLQNYNSVVESIAISLFDEDLNCTKIYTTPYITKYITPYITPIQIY